MSTTNHDEAVAVTQDGGNDDTIHHKHMRVALDLAEEAHSVGEVPVGCVFVYNPSGEIIGKGRNRTNESLNGTRHAEFEGIDMILSKEEYRRQIDQDATTFWRNVTLYVTIEPCVMCASALRQLGIGQVYFGAGNDRFGGNGSVFHIHKDVNLPHETYPSEGGYYRGEAIMVLRKFYVGENTHAPEPKKKNRRVLKEDV
ncbi:tRNA(adenine34) deaminase [Podila verticillata]|nr:tRNA(adenine34) deaminase [Podila verticillata]